MINDLHVHSGGKETAKEILKDMDAAGVEKAVILSPYGKLDSKMQLGARMSISEQKASIGFVSKLGKEAPGRIVPFAWIEPTLKEAPAAIDRAVNKMGIKGVKMIPHHWYPYDEELYPVYEKIQDLGVPILFHSGILWGFMDSSRFCRPCFFEVMLHFPKIRFALAHISWPWTDECIATWGRMRAGAEYRDEKIQMFIDTTRGTPDFYREDALRKAIQYGALNWMIFGTDGMAGQTKEKVKEHVEKDKSILKKLGVSKADQTKYFSQNFEALFEPVKG
jgi:uncharacterized protein